MGIGVNLTPPNAADQGSQLFADGESDGWYAYLQVGDHLVTYPGTFDLAGNSAIFEVP